MPSSRAHKEQKGAALARAQRAMRRQYADGGDVVTERATILPLGTYADGTTRAAWPGILYEPAAAWKRMIDRQYRPGNAEEARQMAEDSFTVASTIPVAGLAAGAVRPGASLGSGGGRLGKSLPMDEASRMARAREMGFDTERTWYHGSDALPFDRFELGQKGASADIGRPSLSSDTVYFADDPKHSAYFGKSVEPFYVRGKTMDADVSDGFAQWAKELGFDDPQKAIDVYYDGSIYQAMNLDDTFADLIRKAKAEGYDNIRASLGELRGKDFGGSVMIVRDPRNIRSVNAAFDPSKTDSADLLAANPSTASILAFLDKYSEKK